jgi:hypothetical protein
VCSVPTADAVGYKYSAPTGLSGNYLQDEEKGHDMQGVVTLFAFSILFCVPARGTSGWPYQPSTAFIMLSALRS